jgi:hypothetical protein
MASRIPEGLSPCPTCGMFIGVCAEQSTLSEAKQIEVGCKCSAPICKRCGRPKTPTRPIGNFFETETGKIWHVPHFAAMGHRCPEVAD